MTKLEAIEQRISRRSYLNIPIESDKQQLLKEAIQNYNHASGLSIQIVEDGGIAFQGFRKSYGMFRGVRSFIALIGKKSDPDLMEKAGYYGELLVLEATALGLGTCFVGASYDKKNCPCTVESDEALVCVITVGPVEASQGWKERMVYRMAHIGSGKQNKSYDSSQEVPAWFIHGVKAAQLAPSAINRHPARFSYNSGIASAYVESTGSYNLIDLGIAKANFELAAGGHFKFGNHGIFIKD